MSEYKQQLKNESFKTREKIYEYAVANVAITVYQDDVTRMCDIKLSYYHMRRHLKRNFARTKNLINLLVERYPVSEYICLADY